MIQDTFLTDLRPLFHILFDDKVLIYHLLDSQVITLVPMQFKPLIFITLRYHFFHIEKAQWVNEVHSAKVIKNKR